MQKQVNFFEQNVQWFALGLGGLFLLFMVFTYVLGQPVKATAGGKELGPGEVDPATLNGPVKQLKQEIARTDMPEIPQKDYVQSFVATIQGTGQQFEQLAGTMIAGRRMEPVEVTTPDGAVATDPKAKGKFPIVALPKLPAPRFIADTQGRSQVTFQDPAWEPDPRRPDKLPTMIEEDTDWWSGMFRINAEQLAKAFEAAFDEKKIDTFGLDPNNFMKTALIDVELVRQEILPGNRVGQETVIQPLRNNPLRPPYPGKGAPDQQVFEYLDWATKNPQELTSPVFFEVLNGDPWMPPGEENERLAAMDREQRRQQKEQMRQQQRQMNEQRRAMNNQRRGIVPRGMIGEDMGDVEMGMMQEEEFAPPQRFIPGRGPVPPPVNRFQRGAARLQQQQQQVGQPLQPGKNNDVRMLADIDVIAHDDTVEPGKTYRYKVRYKLYNPIYSKRSRVAPQELASQFALVSADSAWTQPVAMRPKVEFFLAGINNDSGKFEVFEWKDGQLKKNVIQAAAGDAIGETGWSMVDVRGSGRKAYLMIMDENGYIARRDPEKEKDNERYQDLNDEIEFATPQVGLR
jgi:hypothetical protein